MKFSRRIFLPVALFACALAAGCNGSEENANTTANANAQGKTAAQTLTTVDVPDRIKTQRQERGEMEEAAPVLKIVEPAEGSTVDGSTVKVRLDLGGDLKGYEPHKNPDGTGNHIHVILDNEPYEAYYELGQPFELRNVSEGQHTLRVFASRPWHESYKNEGSFQMVTFNVRGGGDPSKPTTTNAGQRMADNRASEASPAPAAEGKDFGAKSKGDATVDRSKPLLTYSRPKGEYKGVEADPIMIDFWLTNARLEEDGGEHRVRYSVDGGEPQYIKKWQPVWLKGWTEGKHKVKLELVDRSGNVVQNGSYNTTEREITVAK